MRNFAYALRQLRNSPKFTVAAVLSLALGIAGNATLAGVLYSAVLRPLPYHEANRLVVVWESQNGNAPARALATPANFVDWQRQNDVFESMALCQAGSQPVTMTLGAFAERVQSQYATSELFGLLGVRAALGHTFFDREAQQAGRAIVLSHAFWRRRFGGDPSAIGKSILLSDSVYRIIGVMSKGFQIANFGVETDVWRQISMQDPNLMNRQIRWLLALGRLKRGIGAAQADLRTIAQRLLGEYPPLPLRSNPAWAVFARAEHVRKFLAAACGEILKSPRLIGSRAFKVPLFFLCLLEGHKILSQFGTPAFAGKRISHAKDSKQTIVNVLQMCGRTNVICQPFPFRLTQPLSREHYVDSGKPRDGQKTEKAD